MSVDSLQTLETEKEVACMFVDAIAEEFDVDREDIRVRIEKKPLPGELTAEYKTTMYAEWIGDGEVPAQ